jgi:MinD-like ATPase involved in chromosome partitioning or flagellar assembly
VTEIITFYSYKGGVGRSLMLAGVAALLVKRGYRVTCVDFDLQSGGLHTIFGLESKDIAHTILDLLSSLSPLDVQSALIELTGQLPFQNREGKLWLLPAVTESEKIKDILESGRDLTMLLGHILSEIADISESNFILVDSRSGFAELASGPILNADRLICVLRPNRQNAEGINNLLSILSTLGTRPTPFLALSQVPAAAGTVDTVQKLRSLMGDERDFDIALPYLPELSLEENVLVLLEQSPQSINVYEPVVNWLEGYVS